MKFTKRRNGTYMGTMQIRYHVPKEMFDFIEANTPLTKKDIEKWIWANLEHLCEEWRGLYIDDEEPYTYDFDVADQMDPDELLAYEGPDIARSRR